MFEILFKFGQIYNYNYSKLGHFYNADAVTRA